MGKRWIVILIIVGLVLSGCIGDEFLDMDNDGIEDSEDLDRDGDGWGNLIEINCNSNPDNFEEKPSDLDNDTICDTLDIDIDGDDLPNEWETERGFDPMDKNDTVICHGLSKYCLRNYDDFTFPETHNAFATSEDGVILGTNHYTGLQAQWDGGIKAFTVDVHHLSDDETEAEDVRFCHGSPGQFPHPCAYSEVDAFEWLSLLNSLMNLTDESCSFTCGEVVSILVENYVPAEHLEFLFNKTGMLERLYIHQLGEPWPSIGDMILQEKDIVVYVQSEYNESFPYFHSAWKHSWDTPYGQQDKEEMTCELGRGDSSQSVWHLSNWLSSIFGTADPYKAHDVNEYDFLLNRTIECWEIMDKRPTFVAVDYWEDGEITNVTITLNKMENWDDEIPQRP